MKGRTVNVSDSPARTMGPKTLAAVALSLLAIWYQESVLCNALDANSELARVAAALVSCVLCLAVLLLGRKRPDLLRPKRNSFVAATLGAATIPLVLSANPVALAVAFVSFSFATVWSLTLTVALVASSRSLRSRELVAWCSMAAAAVGVVCLAPVPGPDNLLAHIVCPLTPLFVTLLFGRGAIPVLETVAQEDSPDVAQITQPDSFLPFSSRLFVALALLGCVAGSNYLLIARSGMQLGPLQLAGAAVLCVIVTVLYFTGRCRIEINRLYWVAVTLEFLGLVYGMFWPYSSPAGLAAVVCLIAGTLVFHLTLLELVCGIADKNVTMTVPLAAFAVFAVCLGLALDGGLWLAAQTLRDVRGVPSNAVMLAFFVVFMVYNLLFLHNYDFDGVTGSIRPLEHVRRIEETPVEALGKGDLTSADALTCAPARTDGSQSACDTLDCAENETPDASPDASPSASPGAGPDAYGARECIGNKAADAPGARESPAAQVRAEPSIDELSSRVAGKHGLTAREQDVLILLARGYSGLAIQEKLVVSRNTVKTHVRNVYAKLGVHSQQELIDFVESAS